VHYIARHGESGVAKAVLISAVPPYMVETDANPDGLPKSVFEERDAEDVQGIPARPADHPRRDDQR
jgi:non-heme chloroperoxidase